LVDNLTTVPPAAATPDRVTVPVEGEPPATDVGFTEIETREAGLIVR